MMKVLIIHDSKTGNTKKMAVAVSDGVNESGVGVKIKRADECSLEDLEGAHGIIIGSPTHFGTMSERMKRLVDNSIKIRGKLKNTVGAAFTSSHSIYGGNETTLISLIQAMLIHSMIIVGDPAGHYGVVALGEPDEKVLSTCRNLGKSVGEVVKKIWGVPGGSELMGC